MKRLLDITLSAILLFVLSPLFAIIALAVWLNDRGPIIYRGARIGLQGRPFRILKFRSMIAKPLVAKEITVHNDARVTRVGRVLRVSKLDELPQLVNVLCGDMSLVGPRPEAPHFVAHYTAQQREVLTVRPGITGVTQLAYRHEEQLLTSSDPEQQYLMSIMPVKLDLDLDYVHNRSLLLDCKLLFLTISILLGSLSLHSQQRAERAGATIEQHTVLE